MRDAPPPANPRHPALGNDSLDLQEFLDQLTELCKAAGHSGQYGDNPLGMVTDIINQRDALKEVLRRSILPYDVPTKLLEGEANYSKPRESEREFLQ